MKVKYLIPFMLIIFTSDLPAKTTATAARALAVLQQGNKRFVEAKLLHPNSDSRRRVETATKGQSPFATVLACSDSRVPVDMIFDQGIGDLFVVKVAGNVCDVDEIGSIEYGVGHLETPLLVVLGHSRCGAVTAVVKGEEVHGSIPELVDNIAPAAKQAKAENPKLEGDDLVTAAVKLNTFQAIKDLLNNSEIVRQCVVDRKVQIVAAIYNIETGGMEWLGVHPDQEKIIAEPKPSLHVAKHEPGENMHEKGDSAGLHKKANSVHNRPDDSAHTEAGIFSTSNMFFMLIFIFVCSVISGSSIFLALYYRYKMRDVED